jgi:hypothetical protein
MHGAARGADELAAKAAQVSGFCVEAYPANWEADGRAAGYLRNERMLRLGPELVLAFFKEDERSPGTDHMVRKAREAGVPVEEFYYRRLVVGR